jgi:class 3 adenylate cyclase/tetratricopeptide (TPR) repeat protein
MLCPRCRHDNPAQSRFCAECGARLALACASCGAELASGAKFCNQCGQPAGAADAGARFGSPESYTPKHLADRILTSKAALDGERKQVTVLFADLKGSMEFLAERDPEDARRLLDPVLERMMDAVHHYEGTVNQVMGDGIMALFGAPLAHEDHAVRACYAALRMQESVRRYAEEVRREHGVELSIRVGLNSGEVVVRSIGSDLRMDYSAVGQTTHLAARMEQLAPPGTTRLTAETLALAEGYVAVTPLGLVPVKGLAAPVEVYELRGAGPARTRLQVSRTRGLTRFVGRDAEMEQLRLAAGEAGRGRGQIVAVVGEPGVGKSRLFYEFIQSHHTHGWLTIESGSVSYGKASAFLPLTDLLRSYLKIEARDDIRTVRAKATGNVLTLDDTLKDAVAPLLWLLDALPDDSPFLALEPAERRRQALAAAKRVLLRESQVQPLMLVFEDLHWVDAETQAFLDSLVESVPASRVLLAVNYRPEYRHAWGSKTFYRQLRVDPLPPESAQDLLEGLLGGDASVAPLKPLLIARTEGNPLFLEESVRTLVETGALTGARGEYRLMQGLDSLRVPATVQAILAARIDRLDPADKRLLQAAAVVGMDVPFAVLQAIAETGEDELRRGLARLQAAEFMYEARLFPELEHAFKHALTHEVAYGGVLQERRNALHAAIVEALERLYAERLSEQVELLAHHALRGRALPKAVKYLREAGAKAVARSALREAVGFFEQALALLDEMPQTDDNLSAALDTRLALGPVLMGLKGPSAPEVESVYQKALPLADRLADAQRRFQVLWNFWYIKHTREDYPAAVQAAHVLQEEAERSGDAGQILEAHHSIWPTLSEMGQSQAAIPHMERGLQLYVREKHGSQALVYGGHDAGACCRWHLAINRWVLGFPEKAASAMRDTVRLVEELQHPQTTGLALTYVSWLEFQLGDRAAAARSAERLLALIHAHGFQPWLGYATVLNRVCGGEPLTIDAFRELYRRFGELPMARWRRTFCACLLAEGCADLGHPELGRQFTARLGKVDRGAMYAPELLRVEGELIARSATPDPDQAERSYREAIELARSRATKSFELRAAMSLARLWREQGRRREALELLAPLYGWFSEGLDTADLRAANALLAELA